MGRLFITIISAIAELERSLVVERVKSGMRRVRLEGRQIGRARWDVDREQVVLDRRSGMSPTQISKKHGISRASGATLEELQSALRSTRYLVWAKTQSPPVVFSQRCVCMSSRSPPG